MVRCEMAFGKACASLAPGRSSTPGRIRNEEKPAFTRYLFSAAGNKIFPEGSGILIRASNGEVVGAVGVTGDIDRDEELAASASVLQASKLTRTVWARAAALTSDRPNKLFIKHGAAPASARHVPALADAGFFLISRCKRQLRRR